MIISFATLAFAYILGSIPSAVWLGRAIFNKDVRKHGSGNAGATNTFRVLGWKPGILVFIIDTIKGFTAVYLLRFTEAANQEYASVFYIAAGLLAVLGHIYPVFAQFKGGKGVATMLGIILSIHLPGALIALGVFMMVFFSTQYVSLGSLAAAVAFPLSVIFIYTDTDIYLKGFSLLLATILFLSHTNNIRRLMHGRERKIKINEKG